MNPFLLPPQLVNNTANQIVNQLAFLAAVGGLSGALVKTLEDLSWVREAINRNYIKAWMRQRYAGCLTLLNHRERRIYGILPTKTEVPPHARNNPRGSAWHQMLELCSAGDESALTKLQSDQICGQLNGAAQLALQYPVQYRSLLEVLASGAAEGDESTVLAWSEIPAEARANPALLSTEQQKVVARYADARTRLSNYVQRAIDSLHVRLDNRWQWWQNMAGFVFSTILTFGLMEHSGVFDHRTGLGILRLVLASIVGGFIAPVARNLVIAVRNWAQ